jgi:flagellar protein FlgJ
MLNTADLSGRFALDAQSIDRLRLQVRQNPQESLKNVAQQFESLFLNMMLKGMREATPGDDLFDSDQSRMYIEMFDRQMAQKLSSGKGIGLADMLVKQLSRLPGLTGEAENIAAGETEPVQPVPINRPPLPVELRPPAPLLEQARDAGAERRKFVERIWPQAAAASEELGISPHFLLAQAALESGWGKSEIRGTDGKNSHNLFGIKAGANWQGDVVEATTTEFVNGTPQKTTARFRAYASYGEAFRDYASLLRNNPRYAAVLENGRDAAGFAAALQRSGYATDPGYADKLTRILNGTALREALAG